MALGKTRKQLLKEIDSKELTEWFYFNKIYPFPADRIDVNAGVISSAIVNALSTFLGGKNSKKDYTPLYFMPKYGKESKKEMSPDEMYEMAMFINTVLGGTTEWEEET